MHCPNPAPKNFATDCKWGMAWLRKQLAITIWAYIDPVFPQPLICQIEAKATYSSSYNQSCSKQISYRGGRQKKGLFSLSSLLLLSLVLSLSLSPFSSVSTSASPSLDLPFQPTMRCAKQSRCGVVRPLGLILVDSPLVITSPWVSQCRTEPRYPERCLMRARCTLVIIPSTGLNCLGRRSVSS